MVVAKSDAVHRALSKQFAEKADGPLKRGYLALVWGAPDRPKGTVSAPLGRHAHARDKQTVRQDGRSAVTHWQVLERFPDQPESPWLACSPVPSKPGGPTTSPGPPRPYRTPNSWGRNLRYRARGYRRAG